MQPRGMTLLEVSFLIVCIAIAGVVLIPVRSRNIEWSRRTTCGQQLGALHKAITMYEVDYSAYPSVGKGKLAYTERPQDALNLLYRQYVDDPRVFSCPSNKMTPEQLANVKPANIKPDLTPSFAGSLQSSYGYSPGHTSSNSRVIIMADRRGTMANSDNHGKNAGQNLLSAGGSVQFVPALPNGAPPSNNLGKDDNGVYMTDLDIFTYDASAIYPDWDSGCQ